MKASGGGVGSAGEASLGLPATASSKDMRAFCLRNLAAKLMKSFIALEPPDTGILNLSSFTNPCNLRLETITDNVLESPVPLTFA